MPAEASLKPERAGFLPFSKDARRKIRKHRELYLVILIPMVYTIIFHYLPMYGIQIGFRDFNPIGGITGSPFVGLKHFKLFFRSPQFLRLISNTLGISVYQILAGFPVPIILGIALNEVRHTWFKKTVQMATYAPHFISIVVMVGMILMFLSPSTGLVNRFLNTLGLESINFMGNPRYFKTVYVLTGIWQNAGYGTIIYLAALSSIDPQLQEAATIDGATRLQKIRYINFPGILPTATILLIMRMGRVMNVGFQKVYLMQNPLNMPSSDIIATYVYRIGLLSAQFSFATAVGFFNSVINLILIILVNKLARRIGETSLW
jgi:putative aldouronate transport system permease protein